MIIRKQIDRIPLASDELYRGLFEHMLEGLAYCRMIYEGGEPRDFVYLEVNRAFEQLTGLTGVCGKPVSEVIPGIRESNPELFEIYGRVASTGAPEKFETYVDALRIWFAVSVYSPKPEHFVAVFENITERKQAEPALRESEERLRQIASSLRETLWLRDAQTRQVLYVNPAFEELTGRTCENFYEKPDIVMNAIHPDDKERVIKALAQRFEGVLYDEEHRIIHLDGSVRWVASRSFPVRNEAGEVYRWASIMEDITERKQAEADQLNYTAFLESLNHITRIVLEAQDLASTLNILVENIARLFGADDGYLALWDEVNEKPIPMVAYGSMKDNYSQLVFEKGEQTLSASLMKAGHPLVIPDIRSSPYVSPGVASLFPNRTMLGLPLIVQDRKIAILILGYNQSHSFRQNEIDQAEIAAQQISLALMKSQLLEDSTKRVKQLTLLHEVALVATLVNTVDRLIERVTELIGKNLFSDNFGILLIDEERGVLRPHPSYRFISREGFFQADISLGQGVTGMVAQAGRPIRVGHVEELKNYINIDPRTSSELCVPIRLQDRVLGVINAESTKPNAFSSDDELLLGTLAGHLATAIEQIRTAQSERQWLDQLAHSNDLIYAIAHITTQIEKALTREEILQTLSSELRQLDLTCTMATYDKERSTFTINYTSMEPKVLERVEHVIGFSLLDASFSLKQLNSILSKEDILHSAAIADPKNEIQILFPRRRDNGITKILQGIGFGPETELLRLPLVFEENLLGILWAWGNGIKKSDLPIMSIFAKQIGSSLERARLFQEVQSLALTDPLTGLQNRRSLFEVGRVEFARSCRTYRPFSCLMMDIDRFKQLNDNYGHPIGDQVLRQVAECAKRSIREVDLIGRYGGEEFVIFLPETDLVTAQLVAERLRASVEKTPTRVSNQELHVTVSIGVSRKDENTIELETLIARADQAMYMAKHRGRNRVATSI